MAATDPQQSLDDKFGFAFLDSARKFFGFLQDLAGEFSFLRTTTRLPYIDPLFWKLRLFLFLQLVLEQEQELGKEDDADDSKKDGKDTDKERLPLLPPADVAFIWACYLIRRGTFRKELPPDKVELYTRIPWTPPMPVRLPADLQEAARLQAQDERSRKAWAKAYPSHPYEPTNTSDMMTNLADEVQRRTSEGCLFALGWRQIEKDVQWLAQLIEEFPECLEDTEKFLSASYQLYYDWMAEFRMVRAQPGTEGPTMNIDLFWHVHQMNPLRYIEFCERDGGFVNWHLPKSDFVGQILLEPHSDSKKYTCCCA